MREDKLAKSLFAYYLDPPPPEKELFSPLERDESTGGVSSPPQSPLSCFRIHQPGKSPSSFQRFDFCPQRGQYHLAGREIVQSETDKE
ncbi:MAG: hypothetical protein SVX43_03725 [Cyanobacteriota bacterium]|nr:hypothetical protein [Cyanobacteriota bacterium]